MRYASLREDATGFSGVKIGLQVAFYRNRGKKGLTALLCAIHFALRAIKLLF